MFVINVSDDRMTTTVPSLTTAPARRATRATGGKHFYLALISSNYSSNYSSNPALTTAVTRWATCCNNMPVTAVYTLERAVVLNQFRIVSAIGRNDHYVTSISLEVTFIFSIVSQVKIMI